MKKHWYLVDLTRHRQVRVFAQDSEDAQTKAESKVNISNSLWMADSAYREDGQGDDDFVSN